MFRRLILPPHTSIVIIIDNLIFIIIAFFVYIMSDNNNKDVAVPAEEKLDDESVRGQASLSIGEVPGVAAIEERREEEGGGDEEKKGEREEEQKDEGDLTRIERGIMAHPASGNEYTARHSIFSCWLVVHFSLGLLVWEQKKLSSSLMMSTS